MTVHILTQTDKQAIKAKYEAKEATQADLAIEYGVGKTTIRRVLRDFGLVTLSDYATQQERNMLGIIKQFGIQSEDKLRAILQRGLQC